MYLLISCVTILTVVAIHNRTLLFAESVIQRRRNSRLVPSLCVLAAVAAHHVEVGIFALGWFVLEGQGLVTLSLPNPTFVDFLYFSGTVYTSLGFGDVIAVGSGRLFAVSEAITGLVLITWTASFTYLKMERNWLASPPDKQ